MRKKMLKCFDVEVVEVNVTASKIEIVVAHLFSVGRVTEGFYDTASHRSQQASQHQTAYQKESTLPKRRCPRRGKPKRVNEAIDMANQTTF